jgi:hypothetical protein
MKKHFSILFVLITIVIIGCSPTAEEYRPTSVAYLDFSYVDEEGNDLLNENTLRYFNIYYLLKDEESGEFERQEARSPQYSFYRHNVSQLITLRVFPNPNYIEGYSTTLIESPRDIIDTLEVQVDQEGQNVRPEIVWYNGDKIWEVNRDTSELYFKITKSAF